MSVVEPAAGTRQFEHLREITQMAPAALGIAAVAFVVLFVATPPDAGTAIPTA